MNLLVFRRGRLSPRSDAFSRDRETCGFFRWLRSGTHDARTADLWSESALCAG
jgi:hypothetical protein